jgi:hypothetical protein
MSTENNFVLWKVSVQKMATLVAKALSAVPWPPNSFGHSPGLGQRPWPPLDWITACLAQHSGIQCRLETNYKFPKTQRKKNTNLLKLRKGPGRG